MRDCINYAGLAHHAAFISFARQWAEDRKAKEGPMTEKAMNQPKCPICKDTGKLTCQRCKNGTPKGDKYWEQGGPTWGCRDCHGFQWVSCQCTHLGGVNYPAPKQNVHQ